MKKRSILQGLLLFAFVAAVFTSCSEKSSGLKVQDVLDTSLSDIEAIQVSPTIDYCVDFSVNTAEEAWATVDESTDIETLFHAIMDLSIESTEGLPEVTIAGGSPRNVVFVLRDNTQTVLQFVDDKQVWINGVPYNFCDGQSVYSEIDVVLANYPYQTTGKSLR
jgi:hypothetical protein